MENADLRYLGEKLREWNLDIKLAEASKQEIVRVLTDHWNTNVVPLLNEEIKECGYFFGTDDKISSWGSGALRTNLDAYPYSWWSNQDTYCGAIDYVRAKRLTLLVNATEAVRELKKYFPDIEIIVKYNFLEKLDDADPENPSFPPDNIGLFADITPETEHDSY